jgi:hypothetical protein
MSDADDKLVGLLRTDLPPERNLMFRIRVLRRRERVQVRRRIALQLSGGVTAAALAAIYASSLGAWFAANVQQLILLSAVGATIWFGTRLEFIPSVSLFGRKSL